METWTETIDAQRAQELLDSSLPNRAVRRTVVEKYALLMLSGDWVPAGGAPLELLDGRLINGQHRLRAVVKVGIPVTFLLRRVTQEQASVTDVCVPRSLADQVAVVRETEITDLSRTAVSCIHLIYQIEVSPSSRPSVDVTADRLDCVRKHLEYLPKEARIGSVPFRAAAVAECVIPPLAGVFTEHTIYERYKRWITGEGLFGGVRKYRDNVLQGKGGIRGRLRTVTYGTFRHVLSDRWEAKVVRASSADDCTPVWWYLSGSHPEGE